MEKVKNRISFNIFYTKNLRFFWRYCSLYLQYIKNYNANNFAMHLFQFVVNSKLVGLFWKKELILDCCFVPTLFVADGGAYCSFCEEI